MGDDFREGKITFPVIVCLKNASSQEIDFWERTMQNLKQKDGDFEIAINFIKKSNAIKISKQKAQHYALQAIEDKMELTDEIKNIIQFIKTSDRGLI